MLTFVVCLLWPCCTLQPKLVKEPFEVAITRGLDYLNSAQQRDGSWLAAKQGKDPAIAALCVMAYLSAGHVPGEGRYAETLQKGIEFVLSCQKSDGLIAAPYRNPYEMYTHGICTLMLAECIGMMPRAQEARTVREKLEKAVLVILKAQRTRGAERGGWRYTVLGTDADLSVTGWQLMALRAARNVGCDIPGTAITDAVGYIQRCHDPVTGGYRYQPNNQVTVACTCTAILGLELSGKDYHRSPEAVAAGRVLLKRENVPQPRKVHFFYGIYYSAQAMFQLGENYWENYRQTLHQVLLNQLPQRANGSWVGIAPDDELFGINYSTAMAILALAVEFRYLPIYQRAE